jgi:hypothetical protein
MRPFRKRKAVMHAVHAQLGREEHQQHGQAFEGHKREIPYVDFGKKKSARYDLPRMELRSPELRYGASAGEKVLWSLENERANHLKNLENRIDRLRGILKKGEVWDTGEEPGFRGISSGSSRSSHVRIPVISRIPVIGFMANYIAGIGKGIVTGRFFRGSMSTMRKLTPEARMAIEQNIAKLLHDRESTAREFEGYLSVGKSDPALIDAWAKNKHPIAFEEEIKAEAEEAARRKKAAA